MSICAMEALPHHSKRTNAVASDDDRISSSSSTNTRVAKSIVNTGQQQPLLHSDEGGLPQQQSPGNETADTLLLSRVSAEIERMRMVPTTNTSSVGSNNTSSSDRTYHTFPPYCLEMLKSIKGNHRCVDCGEQNPQWASYRYGALLCLQCSGHHRSLGVQISSVRSLSMDEWNVTEVISMLEGGNSQLTAFFDRHALTEHTCSQLSHTNNAINHGQTNGSSVSSTVANGTPLSSPINPANVTRLRYKTKAALFYRTNMEKHVDMILKSGPYQGREESRRIANKYITAEKGTTKVIERS